MGSGAKRPLPTATYIPREGEFGGLTSGWGQVGVGSGSQAGAEGVYDSVRKFLLKFLCGTQVKTMAFAANKEITKKLPATASLNLRSAYVDIDRHGTLYCIPGITYYMRILSYF